jgi:O-acetyl-ADP-ribose deacetylase (regulator of RNase III)
MAVEIANGDLLEQRVDAIVNAVNTVGVMGKGSAAVQAKMACELQGV